MVTYSPKTVVHFGYALFAQKLQIAHVRLATVEGRRSLSSYGRKAWEMLDTAGSAYIADTGSHSMTYPNPQFMDLNPSPVYTIMHSIMMLLGILTVKCTASV